MFGGSLDANVLVALLLPEQAGQRAAVAKLYNDSPAPFAVADTALIELVFVLQKPPYKFPRLVIAEMVRDLINMPKINCNRMLFDYALPLFTSHAKLSFEDCCLAVYAELNGAQPLYTFDKKLAKQAPQAKLVI